MRKINLLFTVLLTSILIPVKAAIIYTDVSPDFSYTLDPNQMSAFNLYSIDLDGDNVSDYDFRWDDYTSFNSGWYSHMTFSSSNQMVLKANATNPFGASYLEPLSFNTLIDANSNWGNSFPEPLIGDDTDPNFMGLGDVYVGVKFDISGSTHYGYVLLSFDNTHTVTIKEYAYEDVADASIHAGDNMTTSNSNLSQTSISIYPNPSSDFISFSNNSVTTYDKVNIYAADGRMVFSQNLISSNEKINISSLSSGIYYVQLKSKNESVTIDKLVKN